MAEFTRVDRNLLLRVGKHLAAAAQLEENGYGQNWGASSDAREAKKRFDRLHRDRRDLDALRKRLEAAFPSATEPVGGAGDVVEHPYAGGPGSSSASTE